MLNLTFMFSGAHRRVVWRSVVALFAALWLLTGGVGEFERTAPSTPDTAHALLSSFTGSVVVNGDPTHLRQCPCPSPQCPEVCAAAILPQMTPGLVALGMLAALAAGAGWVVEHMLQSGWGPPRGLGVIWTGQDLLTRYCLARR